MLCSYNYRSESDIDTIFAWAPKAPQWWITAFNPEFPNPNRDIMASIGKIDFGTKHKDLYDALKDTYLINDVYPRSLNMDEDKYYKGRNSIFFDDDGHTVWILWR